MENKINIIYEIDYSDEFNEHIAKHRQSGQKSILIKIDKLVSELRKHPYTGTGRPEPLTYDKKGEWSRRITRKHRLIYSVDDEKITVLMISAFGHYGDK
ncbi:Txe/YoeB family addiction module toxin [Bacteroidia bacterium]|nr:Txe/YoeB family addiction module toxin [Bacteroidia bacterium]GHT04658.1 Txe/YoeB family addiction module toxin [Bacteroidia bacterium]